LETIKETEATPTRTMVGQMDQSDEELRMSSATGTVSFVGSMACDVLCVLVGGQNSPKKSVDETFWQKP
jgi:hypothetical protein